MTNRANMTLLNCSQPGPRGISDLKVSHRMKNLLPKQPDVSGGLTTISGATDLLPVGDIVIMRTRV